MTWIASSFTTNLHRGQFSGQLYRIQQDFSAFKRIYLPPSSAAIDRLPSGMNYGNRQYLVGGHTANLMIDEEFRGLRQGISAPPKPTVTSGGGTTPQIGYLRYYDEITSERSPLSTGTEFTGDLNRAWTALPTEVPGEQIILEGIVTIAAGAVTGDGLVPKTNFGELRPGDRIASAADLTRWARVRAITTQSDMTIDDTGMAAGPGASLVAKVVSRVSHVELWLSVFGSLPRFVMRVRLGTTAITESTATLALGEAEISSFIAMPYGEFNLSYNDRHLIAGVEGHRDTVYLSLVGFPERYGGLKFVTAYNEPIVGMFRFSDYVVLLCPDSSYRLQGYTEDDYVRTVLEPKVGGLGHHGNRVTEAYALVPGRKGVKIFNSRFHSGIPTRETEWSTDYNTNTWGWEAGFSVVNPNDKTYQFYPKYSNDYLVHPNLKPYVYVGHYDSIGSVAGGGLSSPEWLSDSHQIGEEGLVFATIAAYLVPPGMKIGRLYRGTNDGSIYVEDESDAVAFIGLSVLATAHFMGAPMDPGGGEGEGEGKELTRLWSYVRTELTATVLRIWPGDEFSYPPDVLSAGQPNLALPRFCPTIPASAEGTLAAKVVHPELPQQPGRGWTFEYRWTNPKAAVFLGLGGVYTPGRPSRNIYSLSGS